MSAAVKLLIGQLAQLTHAEKKLRTTGGLEFQRAWVQVRALAPRALPLMPYDTRSSPSSPPTTTSVPKCRDVL